MKPLESSERQLPSQPVLASAPVITNRWWISWLLISPVFAFRKKIRSRRAVPSSASTVVKVSTVIAGEASIRAIKYLDIV